MNKVNSWKKTEEIEIDLIDLLRKICMQWKQVFVCALVFAVLLGGYGYLKNRNSASESETPKMEEELSAEEEQAVFAAAELFKENTDLEDYLDNSILMQIDPYHKNRVVLLYSIDGAVRQDLQKIAEKYLSFLTNGGLTNALASIDKEMWGSDQRYLSELISAWRQTDSSYQVVAIGDESDTTVMQTVFYVSVTGRDAEMTEQLAADVQTALKDYVSDVKKVSGRHTLSLLNSEKSVIIDSGLQTQQHDKRTLFSTNRTNLKTMTDAFTDAQKSVYQTEAGIDDGQEEEEITAADNGISVKYILVGFAGGIFLYCCAFGCLYMFRDTVKSQEEFKTYYNFPFYGRVPLNGKGRGRQRDAAEREKAQMLNRVRLACQKQEVAKLCLAADFSLNRQEKECLKDVSRQLKEWGIDTILGENISGNISIWDTLSEVGVVLMICKIGTTTHRMIDEEMTFYMENDIDVIGAAALEL